MKILDLKDSHLYNLQFDVDGQFVKRTDTNLPVAKCKNLFKAKFNFIGDEWTGTKTALFAQGEYSKSVVLDDNDECVIPWEFFDTDKNMTIGKVSVSCGDLVTTNCATVKITKSGYQESDASVPPSPDVYQQLIELAEDTKEIAQSVRDDADNGVFDGEEGYSPKVSLTEELDGVTVTVQNKDGKQSAKVKNGKDGKDYEHSEEFTKLAEQVRQDKESVEQTVQGFGNTAQQAIQSVQSVGTQAVKEVNTTKSDAVKAVQTESEKQVEAVEDKGQEVINSIPKDFTTQMATKFDKQQGVENAGKALVIGEDGNVVPGEVQGSSSLKYAIKENATGNTIIVTDSAEERLQDFAMQGKMEQESTTGKNLFDITKLKSNMVSSENINIEESTITLPAGGAVYFNKLKDVCTDLKVGDEVYLFAKSTGAKAFVGFYHETISIPSWNFNMKQTVTEEMLNSALLLYSDSDKSVVLSGIMITKLNDKTYEPYTGGKPSPSIEYPQEITSSGKLNADAGKYEIYVQVIRNLFNHTKAKSGWIATSDGKQSLVALGGSDNVVSDYIPVHSEIKYTVSTPAYKFFYDSEKKFLKYENLSSSIVIPNNVKYMIVIVPINRAIVIQTAKKFIIYESDTGLKTLKLSLDRPLTKWDRLEKRDGVWGVVYKSKTVDDLSNLITGKEVIYGNAGGKYFVIGIADANFNYDKTKVFSEVGVNNGNYTPKINTGSFIIGVNDTDTIETAKEHLHYKVIYETDSEEFLPLPEDTQTALNNLHTYYPTTAIANSEDCEMEVEYVADTKNYIDNKISANVASIISQYQTNVANLLSLMPDSVQATMIENDTNNILENVEEMKHA